MPGRREPEQLFDRKEGKVAPKTYCNNTSGPPIQQAEETSTGKRNGRDHGTMHHV